MLTFTEKEALFDRFEDLTKQEISLGRLNYHYEESAVAKTIVVKNLHPRSHNALIYAGYLPANETQDGYLSVIDASSEEIEALVLAALAFLNKTVDGFVDGYEESWFDERGDQLLLRYTNPLWQVIMSSGSVEAVFKTKEAAEGYLLDEGFFEKED